MKNATIRRGVEADIPAVYQLIKELALYEKAPDEVTNTIDDMIRDGFGPQPSYGFFVAETEQKIVAIAFYYVRYSTWKGRCLYLEDIVVSENFRGKGIGQLLFAEMISFGKASNFKLLTWQVLDWNTTAIDFYKKFNAEFDNGWVNGRIQLNQ
jgi:GNAT superfamily N-acetyltransferase